VVSTMLAHDAAVVVADGRQLARFVRRCLEDPDYAAALGDRARLLVLRQLGASRRTFDLLAALVEQRQGHDGRAAA